MGLVLIPATRENLEKSIESSVDESFARLYLPAPFIDEILKYAGIEGIRCWASTKQRSHIFKKLRNGDEILLTEKSTGLFNYYGVVIGKIQNLAFGKALWPITGDNPWEYIYFMANITKIHIPKVSFVQELGYVATFAVPGAIRVKDEPYKKLGTVAERFSIRVADNVAEVSEEEVDYSSKNVQVVTKRRIGHSKFSKAVKDNYRRRCAICQISEPEFLIAGHISTWSADSQNRLNPQNGICFCALHDKAFEHGFIGIDDNYKVVLNSKIDKTKPLYAQLKKHEGKKLSLPSKDSPDKELLKKHRKKHNLGEYDNKRVLKR